MRGLLCLLVSAESALRIDTIQMGGILKHAVLQIREDDRHPASPLCRPGGGMCFDGRGCLC